MLGNTRRRLGDTGEAFTSNWRNNELRKAHLFTFFYWIADGMFTLAISNVALKYGGLSALGIATVLRFGVEIPVQLLGTKELSRFPKRGLLTWIGLARAAVLIGAGFITFFSTSLPLVYALVIASSVTGAMFTPASMGLQSKLTKTPQEGVALYAVKRMSSKISFLLGGVISGIAITLGGIKGGTSLALIVAGMISLGAVWFIWTIKDKSLRKGRPSAKDARPFDALTELGGGLTAIVKHPDIMLLVGLGLLQSFSRAALGVFIFTLANNVFFLGQAGASTYNSAIAICALVGALIVSIYIPHRIGVRSMWGIILRGGPLLIAAIFYNEYVVLILVGVTGFGQAVVETSLSSFTRRAVAEKPKIKSSRFSMANLMLTLLAGVAAGALATWMQTKYGVRNSLGIVGFLSIAAPLICYVWVVRLERRLVVDKAKIDILYQVPMLAPLPASVMESLLREMKGLTVQAGDAVFEQGAKGDYFYIIESGEADVERDGKVIASLKAGDQFGEIALLEKVPRTATIKAVTDLELLAIDKSDFVPVINGDPSAQAEASELIAGRLAEQEKQSGLEDI